MGENMKMFERLAAARYESGLSMRDLAKATGISNSIVSRIMTGKIVEPSFYKIVKICSALNIPLDDLAKTDIPRAYSEAQRKAMAEVSRRTWKNPESAAKMKKAHIKSAERLNAKLTTQDRKHIGERGAITRASRKMTKTIE